MTLRAGYRYAECRGAPQKITLEKKTKKISAEKLKVDAEIEKKTLKEKNLFELETVKAKEVFNKTAF